jgi:CRISPR/Cas system-associated protein Cas5 (RAMP superfamily)
MDLEHNEQFLEMQLSTMKCILLTNKTIKKWINNPILLDYERCSYNKCNEISKKLMKKVIEVSRKTKLLKNKVINPDEESFYKEFDDLLEKQNISDKELKKILELNMKITLL